MTKVAVICEGNFERAVIDILLEHDCLKFNRADMLEEEILDCRSARNFQRKCLNKTMGHDERIIVYRILDSKKERFKITGPYQRKIERIENVITAPEMEMLMIHAEGCYEEYSRSGMKPSTFITAHLKTRKVKNYDYIIEYFSDIKKLANAIKVHHSKTQDKTNTIYAKIMRESAR